MIRKGCRSICTRALAPAVQRNMQRIWALAACAIGMLLLIGFFGFRTRLLNQRMKVYRELQAELAKAEKQMPMFRRMQQQAATLQNWNKEGRLAGTVCLFECRAPGSEDLYITSFGERTRQHPLGSAGPERRDPGQLGPAVARSRVPVKPLAITPGSENTATISAPPSS